MDAARLLAVVRADVLVRYRRPSTVVVFLLLSAVPYLWIPDPSTGRALLQAGGQRVLYDSAALGMATATIAALFVGLFGFYVVSNAVRRDVQTRCGDVLASTQLRRREYVAGKFLGNVLFLATFLLGFLATAMAMQLVRGEAPLRPLAFVTPYLLLLPPTVVAVSTLAILFECAPVLRSRFGDVLYFFVWLGLMGVTIVADASGGRTWLAWFDYSGMSLVVRSVREALGTNHFSIGASSFDPALPVVVFPGLVADGSAWTSRFIALLTPLPALAVATGLFHRFDPARVKRSATRGRGWLARVDALAKPLARRLAALLAGSGPVRADAVLTLTVAPAVTVVMVALWLASAAGDATSVFPIALAALAVAVADVSTRDRRSGTLLLVHAAPRQREGYARFKLAASLAFALVFLAVPLALIAAGSPGRLPGAVAGVAIVVAGATALGIATGNPKTFVVVFLSAWYVAINDKGTHPWMDFGAFHPSTPWTVALGHAALALALAGAADGYHRARLRRD